jgi:hypothetical protein
MRKAVVKNIVLKQNKTKCQSWSMNQRLLMAKLFL